MVANFFDKEPAIWQELEEMLHQAFTEMGYVSNRAHKLKTVRSTVEIDVHAIKASDFQKTFFEEWRTGALMTLARMRDQLLPVLRAASGMQEYGLDIIDHNAIEGINPLKKYSIFFGADEAYSDFFINRNHSPQLSMILEAILENFIQ
jgi:hypothetical protein